MKWKFITLMKFKLNTFLHFMKYFRMDPVLINHNHILFNYNLENKPEIRI